MDRRRNRSPVKPIGKSGELLALVDGSYSGFIGYMAGVFPLIQAGEKGLTHYEEQPQI